jgi:uncharacterized protein (DUF2249 family)
MEINPNTRISQLIAEHPDALEAIVSIHPRFSKLRNPLLRKLMAARTTIGMASKIAGCSFSDFTAKLRPLGFTVDHSGNESISQEPFPSWLSNAEPENIVELDVRPVLESGKDPLRLIIEKMNALQSNQILCVLNSFEPTPLISLLTNKGYESFVIHEGELCKTYFNASIESTVPSVSLPEVSDGWEERFDFYRNNLVEIDVRQLAMPMPMVRVLETLATLPHDKALLVHHRKVPAFLLPELSERKFSYLINEFAPEKVDILIYKSNP